MIRYKEKPGKKDKDINSKLGIEGVSYGSLENLITRFKSGNEHKLECFVDS